MKQLTVSESLLYKYRFAFGYLLLVAVGIFTLFYRLGSLLPGINNVEAQEATISIDVGSIIDNPINFIYHLLQYLSITILGPTPFALRLPGILLTLVALFLFYYVIEHRFSRRAAIITSLLFVGSSWLLNSTRIATSETLTVLILLLLIFISTKLDKKYSFVWLVALAATVAISFYTPYFFYLVIAGIILSLPTIKRSAKEVQNKHLYIAGGVFLVLIAPLVYATIRDLSIAKQLLAIPEAIPSPQQYLANLVDVAGHVIWQSTPEPVLHLGTLPMLEIFSVSMVALGLYHYDHELSKNLSRLILGGLLVSILVLAINADQFSYALLLPFVYFVLTGGLIILFTQWNEIFPKNPLARVLAIIPIGILLIIVMRYHTDRYFVAWANNPEVVSMHSEAYVALNNELNVRDDYTTVLNTEEENTVMKPLDQYYGSTFFTDSIGEVSDNSDERRLIITNNAYQDLDVEFKKMLGSPTRIVPSQYQSHPAVLWIYGVSL